MYCVQSGLVEQRDVGWVGLFKRRAPDRGSCSSRRMWADSVWPALLRQMRGTDKVIVWRLGEPSPFSSPPPRPPMACEWRPIVYTGGDVLHVDPHPEVTGWLGWMREQAHNCSTYCTQRRAHWEALCQLKLKGAASQNWTTGDLLGHLLCSCNLCHRD